MPLELQGRSVCLEVMFPPFVWLPKHKTVRICWNHGVRVKLWCEICKSNFCTWICTQVMTLMSNRGLERNCPSEYWCWWRLKETGIHLDKWTLTYSILKKYFWKNISPLVQHYLSQGWLRYVKSYNNIQCHRSCRVNQYAWKWCLRLLFGCQSIRLFVSVAIMVCK